MESRVLKIERKALQAWSQIDVGSGAWCGSLFRYVMLGKLFNISKT